jgi:hypothetical protein
VAKKAATAAEKRHMSAVAELGCVAKVVGVGRCGMPAQVHHLPRQGGYRDNHYETIPLCYFHHLDGGFGDAVHSGRRTWESRHGTEKELLAKTLELLK